MLSLDDQASLQKVFSTSQSFLILLRSQPSFDQVAAALALTMALQAAKKQVHLTCEQKLGPSHLALVGGDLVHQEVGNHSLQISFDYSEEMVENVSYNIDQQNKKFNLIVRPRKGFSGLDPTTVQYTHVGIDADTIIMIGITSFEQIQMMYAQDEAAFTQSHTIAINRQQTTFAETNIDVSTLTSTCEWMVELIKLWQLPMSSDVATDLLAGIESSTDAFRHASVTAETFEIIAQLMRLGAKRIRLSAAQQSSTSSLAQAFAQKLPTSALTPMPAAPKPPIQMPSQWSPPTR